MKICLAVILKLYPPYEYVLHMCIQEIILRKELHLITSDKKSGKVHSLHLILMIDVYKFLKNAIAIIRFMSQFFVFGNKKFNWNGP